MKNEIEKAYDILKGITESSYIPFTSPSPSSTEHELKQTITDAMRMLERAKNLHTELYGTESVKPYQY